MGSPCSPSRSRCFLCGRRLEEALEALSGSHLPCCPVEVHSRMVVGRAVASCAAFCAGRVSAPLAGRRWRSVGRAVGSPAVFSAGLLLAPLRCTCCYLPPSSGQGCACGFSAGRGLMPLKCSLSRALLLIPGVFSAGPGLASLKWHLKRKRVLSCSPSPSRCFLCRTRLGALDHDSLSISKTNGMISIKFCIYDELILVARLGKLHWNRSISF